MQSNDPIEWENNLQSHPHQSDNLAPLRYQVIPRLEKIEFFFKILGIIAVVYIGAVVYLKLNLWHEQKEIASLKDESLNKTILIEQVVKRLEQSEKDRRIIDYLVGEFRALKDKFDPTIFSKRGEITPEVEMVLERENVLRGADLQSFLKTFVETEGSLVLFNDFSQVVQSLLKQIRSIEERSLMQDRNFHEITNSLARLEKEFGIAQKSKITLQNLLSKDQEVIKSGLHLITNKTISTSSPTYSEMIATNFESQGGELLIQWEMQIVQHVAEQAVTIAVYLNNEQVAQLDGKHGKSKIEYALKGHALAIKSRVGTNNIRLEWKNSDRTYERISGLVTCGKMALRIIEFPS